MNIEQSKKYGIGSLLGDIFSLLKKNAGSLIAFIILYFFSSTVISSFLLTFSIKISLYFSGYDYLGQDNLISVILNPVSLVIILIFWLAITLLNVIWIAGLINGFSLSINNRKAAFSEMFAAGFSTCRRCLNPRNWLFIPFISILMPFNGIINLASPIVKIAVPGFIENFLVSNPVLNILYIVASTLLLLLEIIYIFSLNYFVSDDITFINSCKKGRRLIKNRFWRTNGILLLFAVISFILLKSLSGAISSLVTDIIQSFSKEDFAPGNGIVLENVISTTFCIIYGTVTPLVNICAVTVLFFRYTFVKENITPADLKIQKYSLKLPAKIVSATLVVALTAFGLISQREVIADLSKPQSMPMIVAHRGDSVYAPENTLPAFKMAVEEQVDMIELDVHETKDGVIIVSHDDNLSRVCGQDVCVHELTYAQTQELEVGSWFSEKFRGTKLSTFDEILKLVKNTPIQLQVEIKPTEFDFELEEKVLKLINDNGMHDRCTIICLKSEPLKRIKQLDPTMKTAYCMFVSGNSVNSIEFSDDFTVEENNITPEFVSDLHKENKKVYAWTVNKSDSVQYLLDCGVDGIVTDDPVRMTSYLLQSNYSGGLWRILNIIFYGFANGL